MLSYESFHILLSNLHCSDVLAIHFQNMKAENQGTKKGQVAFKVGGQVTDCSP